MIQPKLTVEEVVSSSYPFVSFHPRHLLNLLDGVGDVGGSFVSAVADDVGDDNSVVVVVVESCVDVL